MMINQSGTFVGINEDIFGGTISPRESMTSFLLERGLG